MNYSFPTHLKHQPIIGINNYDKVDGKYASDTDAMALTLGNAQWDHNDLSAKVWRKEPTKWSRQSEELPLHRVIDLATLIVSVLTEGDTDGEMKYPEGNAKKVSVYGTKGDDKIYVANSQVYAIKPGKGDNKTFLDNCTYKKYNKFWGTGSYIMTGGGEFSSYKKGSDIVKINGDFNGIIYAQQGAGKAYGNDKKAHKDIILINGNNNGYINIDTHDSVKISGKEKGKIINQSIIYF